MMASSQAAVKPPERLGPEFISKNPLDSQIRRRFAARKIIAGHMPEKHCFADPPELICDLRDGLYCAGQSGQNNSGA